MKQAKQPSITNPLISNQVAQIQWEFIATTYGLQMGKDFKVIAEIYKAQLN